MKLVCKSKSGDRGVAATDVGLSYFSGPGVSSSTTRSTFSIFLLLFLLITIFLIFFILAILASLKESAQVRHLVGLCGGDFIELELGIR